MSRRSSYQENGSMLNSKDVTSVCKAVFLSAYDDIADVIESKKSLFSLLQQTGRNPSKSRMNGYWPSDMEQMTFDDFVQICKKEPVTTVDDLMNAFRKIDVNGDGYLSLDELYKIMNKGDQTMSRDEVRKLIDDVDDNKDGKLDYREFTNMMMKTAEESVKLATKVMQRKEKKKQREERRKGKQASEKPPMSVQEPSPKKNGSSSNISDTVSPVGDAKKMEMLGGAEPLLKSDAQGVAPAVPPLAATHSGRNSEKDVMFKLDLPQDSARSLKEELDYDDDSDIVSTGRPTPRVELAPSLTPRVSARDIKENTEENKKVDQNTKETVTKDKDVNDKSKDTDNGKSGKEAPLQDRKAADMKELEKKIEKVSDLKLKAKLNDVPRPSPRARASKTKSPSTRSRDKLLDPSELKDWQHYTSKGCFFYEEEEIVSHVYSLKLYETSNVYLTAKPIDEPACLKLPSTEPVDTALFVLDDRGKLVTYTELRDVAGMFAVQCELKAGEYQVIPYTTGCRFKQRPADQDHQKEAKLVKKDKDDNVVITSAFRQALVDIFELCDLDKNGTLSRDEFNWFNLRTSGETLDEDEWDVVEERTPLENGEITKAGFIALNEMEAEDVKGDVEDLWITLSSMGMNKALIMDEACPFRVNVYVEQARKKPSFQVTGIESLKKEEFAAEICQNVIAKAGDPTKIKGMKDLYLYTYRNDFWATVVVDNKSRSTVNLSVDCSRSRNVVSNQPELNHTLEVDPQSAVVAHHLMPRSELSEWSIACTESIHK